MAEGNEQEQALALVEAGEFTLVHVGIAAKGILRERPSGFLVWTASKPEAWRRAHAYCEARGWQIDWWRDRPGAPLEEALSVHSRRDVRLGRHYVRRGQHEPLPNDPPEPRCG